MALQPARSKKLLMRKTLITLTLLCAVVFVGYSYFSSGGGAKPRTDMLSDFTETAMPEPNNKQGYCSLDLINDHPADITGVNIDSSSEPKLTFQGWAVKPDDHSVADGVIGIIDDKYVIPVKYGLIRKDVATYLKNPGAAYCGFSGTCQADLFDKGTHVISIAILCPDKKHYYRLNNRLNNKFGFTIL